MQSNAPLAGKCSICGSRQEFVPRAGGGMGIKMDLSLIGSPWIYLIIFVGKILEVTVATVRVVLITKGQKIMGAFIALFEMTLWIFITGTVLAGFKEDILRTIVFILAFSVGNYLGSWLENKLAFGLASMQVIIPEREDDAGIVDLLRERGFAVTSFSGKGKDGKRELLIMYVQRKRIREAEGIVKKHLSNAVIVINDSKIVYGGFLSRIGRRE